MGTFIGRIEYEGSYPLVKRFYVQAKIGDDPEHPYGQWSLVVDPFYTSHDFVKAQFAAPDAPTIGAAHIATKIELFRGVRKIGTLTVIEVVCL